MHQTLWCDPSTTFKKSRARSHAEHHIRMGTRLIQNIFQRGGITVKADSQPDLDKKIEMNLGANRPSNRRQIVHCDTPYWPS